MSAAEQFHGDDLAGEAYDSSPSLSVAAEAVEVRRSVGLSAVVSLVASAVAIAWFARAITSGALLDWALVAVTGLISVFWLSSFVDARTPLLVADQQGIRARLGRTWLGLPWSAVSRVEHWPRRGLLRDGVLDVVPHNPDRLLSELTPRAARQARLATRLHGGALALPIGLGTRVTGVEGDLARTLEELSAGAVPVVVPVEPTVDTIEDVDSGEPTESFEPTFEAVEVEPTIEDVSSLPDSVEVVDTEERSRTWSAFHVTRRVLARSIHGVADRLPGRGRTEAVDAPGEFDTEVDTEVGAELDTELDTGREELDAFDASSDVDVTTEVEPSETPDPVREVTFATRSEVLREVADLEYDAVHATNAADGVASAEESSSHDTGWSAKVRPIARESHPVEPLVIDDLALEPALDPVIGPEIRAARTRIGLSADQLAERTRIRPHVIEAMEVDDFVPCGGDFYARGHLRTLARVLGIDVQPLLVAYDERYANAPIDARRVFEAELASGTHGPIRGMRGGPNWSVLVAAVMAVVLCWSVAQLVMDAPAEVRSTPVLDGSGGPGGVAVTSDPVKVTVEAPESGAEVVVRDQAGKIVFEGRLAIGEGQQVEAVPPVRVQSSDGSVTVSVAGKQRGPIGDAGEPGQGTYAAGR